MRHEIPLFACLALTLFVGCREQEQEQLPEDVDAAVVAVHDETADFASYRTFAVVEPADVPAEEAAPPAYLDSNQAAVVDAVVREMEARGYTRDQADPDLMISPLVRLDDTEVVGEQPNWHDYYYGWYWGYADPWYEQDVIVLEPGTLLIDAVDVGARENVEDDKLVFRGYAAGILAGEPADESAKISEVVTEIFTYWPAAAPRRQ